MIGPVCLLRKNLLLFVVLLAFVLLIPALYSSTLSAQEQAWRSDSEQRMIDIYKKTNEAVVFITTINLVVDPFDLFSGVKRSE